MSEVSKPCETEEYELIIDYSANDTWNTCPAKWWELYVAKRRKKWPAGQRDDALALGSLTHEGLRVWQQEKRVEIPQPVIEEVTPTRECLSLAMELVQGYTRAYPQEIWPLILCEEPITFPLKPKVYGWKCETCKTRGTDVGYGCRQPGAPCPQCGEFKTRWLHWDDTSLIGLAKIDSYFYVPEPTQIDVGVGGLTYLLNPGWWIHEYKTKSPYTSMGLYMQSWETNLQASYQLLALQGKIGEPVAGILVNVLEKPRRHIPKRKCRSCEETYEFATWVPTGTGEYACPVCGQLQVLTPLKKDVPTIPPAYYRIIVTRTQEELARDKMDIIRVGQRMIAMEAGGLASEVWNKKSCVDMSKKWDSICPFFTAHRNNTSTLNNDMDFEPQTDYRGLVQMEI